MSLDLGKIGKAFKSASNMLNGKPQEPAVAGPVIVAMVLSSADEALQGEVVTTLKGLDLDFSKIVKGEDGETVTFSIEGEIPADAAVVKLNDNVAVVIKGFSPYSDTFEKTSSFAEAAATQGFYSNVNTAASVLTDVVRSQMYSSATKAEGSAAVAKSLTEFSAYVSAMVAAIPETAFKADTAVSALIAKSADFKKKEKDKADEAAAAAAAAESKATPPAKEVKKEEGAGVAAPVVADPAAAPDFAALIAAAMAPVTKAVTDLGTKIEEVRKTSEQSIAEIARKAEDAAQAVKTTVLSAAGPSDEPAAAEQTTQKSDYRTGAFDTGLMGRNR